MKEPSIIEFVNDKRKWFALFFLTFAAAFYWLPEEVPLFYSQALPEDKLASKYFLLLVPGFTLLFWLLIELFLTKLTLRNENMLRLTKWFKIGLMVSAYIIFLKIIILVI
jgi:hypothetical protein